jgi:mRNA interferase MazF
MAILPSRGEIWEADLDPTEGHEQAGKRPVLVVSNDKFNHGPAELVIVAPLTRTGRRIPLHVEVDPPEGGLSDRSYILCDSVRSISRRRLLGARPRGVVSPETMEDVEDKLRILLDLF